MATSVRELPQELRDALDDGCLTDEQFRQLIEFRAAQLNLTYDAAIELGRRRALPRTTAGMELQALVCVQLTAAAGQDTGHNTAPTDDGA